MIEKKNHNLLSLGDLARKCHVSRQAIYVAMKKKKFRSSKINGHWFIDPKDYDHYRAHKYDKLLSEFQGGPLYDADKKEISPKQAAKLVGISLHSIYYHVRKGNLKYIKRGSAIILNFDDCIAFFSGQDQKQTAFL